MDDKQENDDNKLTYKKVILALLVLFLVVGCSEGRTSVEAAGIIASTLCEDNPPLVVCAEAAMDLAVDDLKAVLVDMHMEAQEAICYEYIDGVEWEVDCNGLDKD